MAGTHAQEGLHHTRKLLDELDALMDQMLALPVNDQDVHEQVNAPPGDAASHTPTVSATLTMLAPPEAPPEEPPSIQQGRVTVPEESDRDITMTLTAPVEPMPPAPPLLTHVAAPPHVELLPLPPKVRSGRWTPDGLSHQMLLWINQRFERTASWLGWPGRLLASSAGRTALGFIGLAFWIMALAWLCRDWLGW